MKFEYDKDTKKEDCVAYIKTNGELVFRNLDTGLVVCIGSQYEGKAYVSNATTFEEDVEHSVKKFYPGDKLTITF